MPRIQILALPEGAADERPPFLLVIDQAPYDGPLAEQLRNDAALNAGLAERTGARGVLLFEDTVDIPANDTSAYVSPTMIVRVEGDADAGSADLAEQIRHGIERAQAAYGPTA